MIRTVFLAVVAACACGCGQPPQPMPQADGETIARAVQHAQAQVEPPRRERRK